MKYFCDVLNCIDNRYTVLLNGSKTFKLGNIFFCHLILLYRII